MIGASLRAGAACLALTHAAHADEPLRLQLGTVRQAQFAGYYVAQAKGYYAAAGLAVTILPGPAGGDALPPRAGADIWSAWLPQALQARDQGLALVNIAQIFPHSGLELVCRKASGIRSPADLKGKTVGVWQDGAQIPFQAWMRRLNLAVPRDVTVLALARAEGQAATDPLVNRDAACVSALNYDQYWQFIDAGMAASELQVFHDDDAGVATLQDGLYATEAALADPARAEIMVRFLRASVRGWAYAVTHQPEAVDIVLDDGSPRTEAATRRQTRMMSAVARLTAPGLERMGYLEPAAFDRTVQLLLQADPPVPVAQASRGAWTHAIWRRATK